MVAARLEAATAAAAAASAAREDMAMAMRAEAADAAAVAEAAMHRQREKAEHELRSAAAAEATAFKQRIAQLETEVAHYTGYVNELKRSHADALASLETRALSAGTAAQLGAASLMEREAKARREAHDAKAETAAAERREAHAFSAAERERARADNLMGELAAAREALAKAQAEMQAANDECARARESAALEAQAAARARASAAAADAAALAAADAAASAGARARREVSEAQFAASEWQHGKLMLDATLTSMRDELRYAEARAVEAEARASSASAEAARAAAAAAAAVSAGEAFVRVSAAAARNAAAATPSRTRLLEGPSSHHSEITPGPASRLLQAARSPSTEVGAGGASPHSPRAVEILLAETRQELEAMQSLVAAARLRSVLRTRRAAALTGAWSLWNAAVLADDGASAMRRAEEAEARRVTEVAQATLEIASGIPLEYLLSTS